MVREAVITGGARTAIGAFGGRLMNIPGPDLAAMVVKEAIKRSKIEPGLIEDVIFGNCMMRPDEYTVGRLAGLKAGIPIAKLVSYAAAGVEPELMSYGPVPATQKALAKARLKLQNIELIELNEAFAAQYMACEKLLGLKRGIVNVNGSGIALGHPVGCTGTRIIISLLNEMKRRGNKLGLATLCVGGGMGMTSIWEML